MGFGGGYWGLSKFTVTSVETYYFYEWTSNFIHTVIVSLCTCLFRVTGVGRMRRKVTAISYWALAKKSLIQLWKKKASWKFLGYLKTITDV